MLNLKKLHKGMPIRLLLVFLAVATAAKTTRILSMFDGRGSRSARMAPLISSAMAASEHSEPHKTPETPTPSKGEKTHDLDKNTSDNAGPPPVALPASEEALLSQLRDRRQTVEQREAELDRKRQMITQAERKLIERADQLSKLETQLEHLEAMRREHDESNWKGLVKTYETMKPRDAASIMNDLDLPTTLQVLDRMKDAKAGMVLAAMTPDRARLVTTELAQMRSKSVTIPEAK